MEAISFAFMHIAHVEVTLNKSLQLFIPSYKTLIIIMAYRCDVSLPIDAQDYTKKKATNIF